MTKTKHLALLRLASGTVWHTEATPDRALQGVCKEFHSALPEAGEQIFGPVYIYEIPLGFRAYWNDEGVWLVNMLSDIVEAAAPCSFCYEEVSSKRPLSTCRLNIKEAHRVAYRAEQATFLEAAPIGQKV